MTRRRLRRGDKACGCYRFNVTPNSSRSTRAIASKQTPRRTIDKSLKSIMVDERPSGFFHHVQFDMRFKVADDAGGAGEAAALGGIHAPHAGLAARHDRIGHVKVRHSHAASAQHVEYLCSVFIHTLGCRDSGFLDLLH